MEEDERPAETDAREAAPPVHTTECDHHYAVAGGPEPSGLTPVSCTRCWGGHLVDLARFDVLDGTIAERP